MLTLRHELFCQEYAACLSEDKAMRAVGLKPRSPSLLDNEEVQERVAELVQQRVIRLQITGDWILVQLSKNVVGAREAGEFNASTSALRVMAEVLGIAGKGGKAVSPSLMFGFGGASTNGSGTPELAERAEHDDPAE